MMAGPDDSARKENRGREQAAAAAIPGLIKFNRMKMKAMTVVAKTSKKPSTHRWTTHQRQYSTMRKMRMLTPRQSGAIKQGDGGRRTANKAQAASARLVCATLATVRESSGTAIEADQRTMRSATRGPDRRTHSPDGPDRTTTISDILLWMLSHSPVNEPTTTTRREGTGR